MLDFLELVDTQLETGWIGEIVSKMLKNVRDNKITDETVDRIAKIAAHPSKLDLFGFTASEYALASLKWVDTPYSLSYFQRLTESLSREDKSWLQVLIDNKLYQCI